MAFLSLLEDKYWLTHVKSVQVNKIVVLRYAMRLGINVPKSYIINRKSHLNLLRHDHTLITKSIYEPMFIRSHASKESGLYSMYTKVINDTDMNLITSQFYPSLVQERISKQYEIRIFYIEGEFYAMAIFSQQNSKTIEDFRKYDWSKPNRWTPYNLHQNLKDKLNALMQQLNLNCGSIDMIKSTDGKYYLLEINPVGQFGMVSHPCNYNLHKIVAEKLIQKDQSI